MKLVRYEDPKGQIYFGSLEADDRILGANDPFTGASHPTLGKEVEVSRILAPCAPPIIFGIGMNYADHAKEAGKDLPEFPLIFAKGPNAASGPGDIIPIPTKLASHRVDFEAELAVVIGKKCKNVDPANAYDVILGYTCANDVSARDWQFEWGSGQFIRGKTFDGFCPLGPAIITADSGIDPTNLIIESHLNGEKMQSSNTSQLIFDIPYLISFLSGSTTLLPGTVILTGTPGGVGYARTPPVYLKEGDQIEISIQGIGTLSNPLALES